MCGNYIKALCLRSFTDELGRMFGVTCHWLGGKVDRMRMNACDSKITCAVLQVAYLICHNLKVVPIVVGASSEQNNADRTSMTSL